jgi:AcrR family transcriptional regulator
VTDRVTSPGGRRGDETPVDLPPGLDLLWGRRERGRTGPKPALSVDAIVEAAIRVADAEGLAAVSMKRVAGELGFTTMSLYRYVDSKDELLAMMWNASATGLPRITGDSWRERLENWALVQYRAVLRRSWILEMPLARPPAGPASLAWVEQAVAALADTGLSEAEKMSVVGLISVYALSESRQQFEEQRAREEVAGSADYAAVLRAVADPQTYPALYRAAWSGELDQPTPPAQELESRGDGGSGGDGTSGAAAPNGDGMPRGDATSGADQQAWDQPVIGEEQFRFGLDRILDGVQMLIDQRAANSD